MIFNMIGGGGSDIDLSGVTAAAGDVRASKVFVDSSGNEVTGTLPDWSGAGGVTIDISNTDAVTIPAGIHSETTVRISETERNKIITSNIKNGVTILGVTGNLTSGYTINGTERQANVVVGATISVGEFIKYFQSGSNWYAAPLSETVQITPLYYGVAVTGGTDQETITIIGPT